MSAQHLEVLDTTLQKTHQWLDAIAEAAETDTHTAYQALRAVLQTLRDRLPVAEAAHFSAQLPLLVRGIFYEGYRPAESPAPLSRREFLQRVEEKVTFQQNRKTLDIYSLTQQVFAVLREFMGEGELDKIAGVLPPELRELVQASR
ncbi:MAG: DUF2267 domain-containing protein [Verrucomicrobiota bacterium]